MEGQTVKLHTVHQGNSTKYYFFFSVPTTFGFPTTVNNSRMVKCSSVIEKG